MVRPRKETPLSVAERVRRYAEKKKGEDPESWLEKGRQKRKTFLEKMSKEEKDDFKRKDRERKRAKRQEEKLRKMQELSTPYKTSAALGKARARVAKALLVELNKSFFENKPENIFSGVLLYELKG